jgi:hypothetical protein
MNNLSAEKKEQLKASIQEKVASLLAMIDNPRVVRNAQQLLDCEKGIAAITDEIAGNVVDAVVSQAVDEEALVAEAKALVKQSPVRMKRRDEREVTIQPYRGNPFTIETVYYTKAGQSAQKAEKKGGSIRH